MGLEVEENVLNTIYTDSGGFPALARQLASAAAIPQERERIIEARRDMLAVGILEKIDTNYRVSGALFRQWIKENRMMNDEC
jgi:hypothetical protein